MYLSGPDSSSLSIGRVNAYCFYLDSVALDAYCLLEVYDVLVALIRVASALEGLMHTVFSLTL